MGPGLMGKDKPTVQPDMVRSCSLVIVTVHAPVSCNQTKPNFKKTNEPGNGFFKVIVALSRDWEDHLEGAYTTWIGILGHQWL